MRETLYKKDTKNKIRFLTISIEEADLVRESGLLDGKSVIHKSTCVAKNVGKSNETSPSEQALFEAESLITRKLREGYCKSIEDLDKNKLILPMLAKQFKNHLDKIEYPCFVQPKLDGMRAISINNRLISRKNKPIITVDHIITNIKGIKEILDGELYVHGKSFQENMAIIKKYRRGETEEISFFVYDIISEEPFKSRFDKLSKLIEGIDNITLVPTYSVNNESEIQEYHQEFISQGYEGTIIRWGEAPYKINGRSENLLKLKDFIDICCEVVDIQPSDRNPEQGFVICKNESGRFGCGMRFSHKEREEILNNKEEYIGQVAEIRFFEYTDDGLPRFPVCVGFRLDK